MGTLKVNGDIHSTGLTLNGDWESNFGIRFREGGTSNDYGAYIMYGLNDAFTFGTRNENVDLTAFSIPRTGNTVTFYGDIIMTSPKAIYANSIIPNTTLSHNIGLSSKEYGDGFIRQIFTRHIEPAISVNNDVYICYNNRGGSIRAYAPLDMNGIGSIVNLPIGGGLYWNPYVESAEDGSDAASITLHANGVGGGTELRISMMNDANDVINLNPASWVYLQGKAAFRVDDSWLRINETSGFSSGIYTGSSLIRSDNCLQVGSDGAAFIARSDGYGRFGSKLDIGSKLSFWEDNEGGNIWLHSGNGHTNTWEIDSYNGNLRFYTCRESDGAFQYNYFDQNNGYIGNAYWAAKAGTLARSGDANYPMTFHWSGQDGQPTWLWGGNDGTNMYVYNPSNFSVNYANTAGWASSAGNADRVYPINSNPNNSHPGYGLKVFYSWDQGQVGNDNGGYANGITIGSHPSDQAYGFQIVQNMWDDRTYTRRYNYGWQSWKTLAWTDDLAAYLPLSGGTMTGHLYATSGLSWNNSYWTPNGNITCTPTGNGQEWSFDVGASGYTGCYWHVWSSKNGCSMLRCDADTNAVGIPNGPLYLGSSCYGPNLPGASYVGQIFFKT